MISFQQFCSSPLSQLPGPIAARTCVCNDFATPTSYEQPCENEHSSVSSSWEDKEKNINNGKGACHSVYSEKIYTLDGKKMGNTANFFAEFSSVLHFPQYFGHNWDAFEECFNDLSWLSVDHIIIDFHHPERILTHSEKEFTIFSHIYHTAFRQQNMYFSSEKIDDSKIVTRIPARKFLLTSSEYNSFLITRWSVFPDLSVYWLS